ncbi:hypothetical protein FQN60_004491 [Etheostoma spectabile]|uniref:CBM21 domain-containing protein n=1 Tax=Etheostoma spectabile TaxID=54343 RepID=A0A5J5CF07_9PERO|nr:hypothetical protein FQN60_004491 [Etheostoma spectabile]
MPVDVAVRICLASPPTLRSLHATPSVLRQHPRRHSNRRLGSGGRKQQGEEEEEERGVRRRSRSGARRRARLRRDGDGGAAGPPDGDGGAAVPPDGHGGRPRRVEFCIQYQTQHQTFWDNNCGNNYRLADPDTGRSQRAQGPAGLQIPRDRGGQKREQVIELDPFGSPRTSAGIFPEWQSWGCVETSAPYW